MGKIVEYDVLNPAVDIIRQNEEEAAAAARQAPAGSSQATSAWERSEVESLLEPLVLECADQAADRGQVAVNNNIAR